MLPVLCCGDELTKCLTPNDHCGVFGRLNRCGYSDHKVLKRLDIAYTNHAHLQTIEVSLGLNEFRGDVELVVRAGCEAPGEVDRVWADGYNAFASMKRVAVLQVSFELPRELRLTTRSLNFVHGWRLRCNQYRQSIDSACEPSGGSCDVGRRKQEQSRSFHLSMELGNGRLWRLTLESERRPGTASPSTRPASSGLLDIEFAASSATRPQLSPCTEHEHREKCHRRQQATSGRSRDCLPHKKGRGKP